jgi:hypothetical protein
VGQRMGAPSIGPGPTLLNSGSLVGAPAMPRVGSGPLFRAEEPGSDLSGLALKLLLFESVDEFDGGEKADALAMVLDGLDADCSGEMRLARAGPPTRTTLWASSKNSQRCS